MKLYLKLGIFVLVLFALVIATCLLWTPVKIRYYKRKALSSNMEEKIKGIDNLCRMGEKGRKELVDVFPGGEKAVRILLDCREDIEKEISDEKRLLELVVKFWQKRHEYDAIKTKSCTSINLAARYGYTELIEILISKGARFDAMAEIKFGQTNVRTVFKFKPLQLACAYGHLEAVKVLVDKYEKSGKVFIDPRNIVSAAGGGHTNIIRFLLTKGADVNQTLDFGYTPLHAAAGEGHINVVRFLIMKGANLNSRSRGYMDNTALDRAKTDEIKKLLRAHGGKTGKEIREQGNKKTREK